MIKYIGSKRVLLPWILETIASVPDVRSVADLFSGTSRVGHALKGAGYRVLANDHNAYAATLARCYVEADHESVARDAERLIRELSSLPGKAGYFTETFCVQSRFFQPKNGARVDAIRDAIAAKCLSPALEAVLLVSLMEAADRVDSTTGVQMAYLKQWAARAHNDLQLRLPDVLPRAVNGAGQAFELDASEAAAAMEADLAYLDPPYNQHKYLGNYHVWETLVRWDAPAVYGIACKRVDCRSRASDYNSRVRSADAIAGLVASLRSRYVLVSFNDEGFLPRVELERILGAFGPVRVLTHEHKRYVGAQIGIYNPAGALVGTPGKRKNKEFLYLAGPREGPPPRK